MDRQLYRRIVTVWPSLSLKSKIRIIALLVANENRRFILAVLAGTAAGLALATFTDANLIVSGVTGYLAGYYIIALPHLVRTRGAVGKTRNVK